VMLLMLLFIAELANFFCRDWLGMKQFRFFEIEFKDFGKSSCFRLCYFVLFIFHLFTKFWILLSFNARESICPSSDCFFNQWISFSSF
jgi:hypothetical protein